MADSVPAAQRVASDAVRAASNAPSNSDTEWAALVGRIVYQDEAALAELYRALSGRVYRYVLRLIRDTGTAEEVVEDVFWQVWRQAPRFDPARGPAIAWLLNITRSRSLDALRTLGRDPLCEAMEIDEDHFSHELVDVDDPQLLLEKAQHALMVEKALISLEPLPRQLVSLAFHQGYSQSEIALQTGIPLGTVKSHIRRGLASMKLSMQTPF